MIAAITSYEEEGIAVKFGDVDLVAELAYRAATGVVLAPVHGR